MPSDHDSRDDGRRRPPERPTEQPSSDRIEDTWFEAPPRRDRDAGQGLYAPRDYDDDDFRAPPPASAPRQRSRTLPVIIALLALAGFAGLLWYAYAWGVGGADSGELPVVAAESSPAKVAPEEPGGMQIPNQDKRVLNRSEGGEAGEVERLLPPPEEPNPPKVSSEPAPELPSEEAQATSDPAQAETAESGQDQGGQAQDEQAQAAPEAPQPETASAPALETEAEPEPEPEPDTQTAQASPEASAPPQLTEPPADSYVMQLASVRSEETARAEWARMQREHEPLLGDMPLFVQQVELEGRGTYFRIQTGPFPSRSTAQDFCAQLKTAGQDCLVTQR